MTNRTRRCDSDSPSVPNTCTQLIGRMNWTASLTLTCLGSVSLFFRHLGRNSRKLRQTVDHRLLVSFWGRRGVAALLKFNAHSRPLLPTNSSTSLSASVLRWPCCSKLFSPYNHHYVIQCCGTYRLMDDPQMVQIHHTVLGLLVPPFDFD